MNGIRCRFIIPHMYLYSIVWIRKLACSLRFINSFCGYHLSLYISSKHGSMNILLVCMYNEQKACVCMSYHEPTPIMKRQSLVLKSTIPSESSAAFDSVLHSPPAL